MPTVCRIIHLCHVTLNDCANLMRRDFSQYIPELQALQQTLLDCIFQTNEDMEWKTHGFPGMRVSME